MALVPISQLPSAATPLTGEELIPLDQGGVTSKATVNQLAGIAFADPTSKVGPAVVDGVASTVMRSDAAPALDQTADYDFTGALQTTAKDVGYKDIPQNVQNGAYQFALTDRGEHVYHTAAGAHVYTIPTHATTAFPIGATITCVAGAASGNVTITPAGGVTLRQGGTTNVGARVLAANGMCTMLQVAQDEWFIKGDLT